MQQSVVPSVLSRALWVVVLTSGCSVHHVQGVVQNSNATQNSNQVIDSNGVITPPPPPSGGVTVTQQACLKDYGTLQTLDSNRVGCGADSDCPTGSYCDPNTVSCRWDCLNSTPATKTCAAGASCDCFGHCLVMGTGASAIQVLPQLAFIPNSTKVTRASSSSAWVSQSVVVDVAADSNTSVQPVVVLQASGGLLMGCGNANDFNTTCTLSGPWSYVQNGNSYHAQVRVALQPPPGGDANGVAWTITATSRDLVNTSSRAAVQGMTLDTVSDGYYTGMLNSVDPNTPGMEPLALPVSVEIKAGNFLVTDTTQVLFSVPVSDSNSLMNLVDATAQGDTGGVSVVLDWGSPTRDGNGAVHIALRSQTSAEPQAYGDIINLDDFPQWIYWDMILHYVGPTQASACPCATGLTCIPSMQICALQDGNVLMSKTVTVDSNYLDTWLGASRTYWPTTGSWTQAPDINNAVFSCGVWPGPNNANYSTTQVDLAGDSLCANGSQTHVVRALAILAQPDFNPNTLQAVSNPNQVNALLTTCLTELDQAAPTSMQQAYPANDVCVSPARLFGGMFYDYLNSYMWPDSIRYLQQWVQLNTFLGTQTNNVAAQNLAGTLAGTAQPSDLPTVVAMLNRLERYWNVTFSSNIMGVVSAASLYRENVGTGFVSAGFLLGSTVHGLGFEIDNGTPQPQDLATSLLQASDSQLELVQTYLSLASQGTPLNCNGTDPNSLAILGRYRAAMHRAVAVDHVVNGIYQAGDMRDSSTHMLYMGNQPWAAQYVTALRNHRLKMRGMVTFFQGVCSTGASLTQAVPLFFDRSQAQSTTQQYFASSSYLLSHATSAVADAAAAESAAQSATIGASQGQVASDEVLLRYDALLTAACGVDDDGTGSLLQHMTDDGAGGTMSPDTCWRASTDARCSDSSDVSNKAGCYSGTIGEAVTAVLVAESQITTAHARMAALDQAFQLKDNYCQTLITDNQLKEQATQLHNNIQEAMGTAATVCDSVADMASAAGSAMTSFGTSVVAGASEVVSGVIKLGMTTEANNYSAFMQQMGDQMQAQQCMVEAQTILTNRAELDAELTTAFINLQSATLNAANLVAQAHEDLREGQVAYAQSSQSGAMHVYGYVRAQAVRNLQRDFGLAQRLMLMAAKALQYDLQQSLPNVGAVLNCTTVEDLQAALADLNNLLQAHITGSQVPGEAKLILSLREDIANVADANSLQNWLRSGQNAVYSASGQFQGVSFRFTPPLQGTYCGERVYWVSVNMQGNWNVENVNYADIVVSKRTVFGSQWCYGQSGGLEQGHVYAGGNPFTGLNNADQLPVDTGYFDDALQASINAAPQDFANRATPPPDGLGLSGLGLYGEYEVFIPADALTRFPLEQLEDIVINIHFNDLTLQQQH